jgi:leucyl/phenylalanyl-tRNA--protein transferase
LPWFELKNIYLEMRDVSVLLGKVFYQMDQCLFQGRLCRFYSQNFKYCKKAYKLTDELYFPPHSAANKNVKMGPCGELLAVGGDLSIERLLLGYRNGVYPLYFKDQPILWWTSEIRCVFLPERINFSKNLRRIARKSDFRLTVDTAFDEVVNACAQARKECTWLLPERIKSLQESHQLGYAHSFEVWEKDELIGGLIGVAIGSYLTVLSKFTKVDNSSKVGMVALVLRLFEKGFTVIDCGFWPTEHLRRMGTEIITREAFLKVLEKGFDAVCPVSNWGELYENWDLEKAVENLSAKDKVKEDKVFNSENGYDDTVHH